MDGKHRLYPFCGNHGPLQSAFEYLRYKGGGVASLVRVLVSAFGILSVVGVVAGLNADLPKLIADVSHFLSEEQMQDPSYIARQEVYLTGISIEFNFTETRFRDV